MKYISSACEPRQNLSLSDRFGSGDSRDRSVMTVHRIIVAPKLCRSGSQNAIRRGAVYTVSYLGEVIVTRSTQPALDAARVLYAMGLIGLLEMWDEESAQYRFRIGIIKAAALTVEEGDRRPRYVKFKSLSGRDSVEAFFARSGVNIAPKLNEPFTKLRPPVAGKAVGNVE